MHYRMALAAWLASGAMSCMAATTVAHTITLSPATAQLRVSTQQTFTASPKGYATAPTLVWKVVSTAASSTGDLGSVTSKGVYTAPAAVPTPHTVLVEAVDSADATVFGSATVTLLSPLPTVKTLSPGAINTGLAYKISITGTNFLPTSQVLLDGTAVPTTFVSSTSLQIAGKSSAAANTTIGVTVSNPGPTAVSNKASLSVQPPITVAVTPNNATVRIGATQQFYSSVHYGYSGDTTVTWSVNGVVGGDAKGGTIDSKGLYTPPATLPTVATAGAMPTVTITAVSNEDPTAKASVPLNLENGLPKITGVSPSTLPVGKSTVTINGTTFAPGGTVTLGGVKYTPTFVSDKQLTVAADISMPVGRTAAVKISNPAPGAETSTPFFVPVRVTGEKLDYATAVRFLEMASWGATPSSVAHLQQVGVNAWLAEQFAAPATALPDPNDPKEGVTRLQDAFFTNALTGNDQLRQRVAFALSSILVASSEKDTHFAQMVSYWRLMLNDAFGNFRTLLGDVTLNPGMGYFLDMVNNDKANPVKNTVANENYAREVMQLFTLGLVQLDPRTGVPTTNVEYNQATVTEMAKVFTGWTYPPEPGFASHWNNPEYNFGSMVPFEEHHDATAKNINLPSPCTIGAGGTAASDLNQVLDCLVKQTNVAPFISYRLIQRLVLSNPSPAYVGRISDVFNNTHGDLKAVVTAILTDSEATSTGTGKLREPVLYSTHLLRALNASVNGTATGVRGQSNAMGQDALDAPSVFSYFSPFYKAAVPNFPSPGAVAVQAAPEFQSINAETAFARINFAYRAVANQVSGNIKIDNTNLLDVATDPAALLDAIDQALYKGQMDAGSKAAVLTGINLSTSPSTRVVDGLYVAAAAPQYQVER